MDCILENQVHFVARACVCCFSQTADHTFSLVEVLTACPLSDGSFSIKFSDLNASLTCDFEASAWVSARIFDL